MILELELWFQDQSVTLGSKEVIGRRTTNHAILWRLVRLYTVLPQLGQIIYEVVFGFLPRIKKLCRPFF